MPRRDYDGDPLDYSWKDIKDRPFKGEGETVDVADGAPSESLPEDVEVPDDLHLSGIDYEILEYICDQDGTTAYEVSQDLGHSKTKCNDAIRQFGEWGWVSREKNAGRFGADLIHARIDSPKQIESRLEYSEWIPSAIRALTLTPTRRHVIALSQQSPGLTSEELKERTGHGGPRKVLNEFRDHLKWFDHDVRERKKGFTKSPDEKSYEELTEVQKESLRLREEGKSYTKIGIELEISPTAAYKTVQDYSHFLDPHSEAPEAPDPESASSGGIEQ